MYKGIPMGVRNYLESSGKKIYEIIHGFEFIWTYTDDLFVNAKIDWSNHLEKLVFILQNIEETYISLS